ncbi:hypothetical protein N7G274_004598 [Stereocaulon virgatum]|uniref:Protein kinase domain-containing protein n=1 Tax=Stereocaulon virgatum TaxID=373712 RepID=A0ABR4AAR8_9LECA
MDPISIAGLGLSVASVSFQLFAGCIKGFVLLSTAHNLGKDSSALICQLNLQEIQLTEWARCAGLLAGDGSLDRRLNEKIVHATLKELQDLLLDTEKLKVRYKLGLASKSLTPQSEPDRRESPVAHGILSNAISNELRADVMYKARLIQSKNSFPQRLWWAAVDKAKFEELIGNIRSFIRELWYLLDPIRQRDVTQSLQMILSHVIGISGKVDELCALSDTITASSNIGTSSMGLSGSLPLASAAEIKAIKVNLGETSNGGEHAIPQSLFPQYPGQPSKVVFSNLDTRHLGQYKPMKNNAEMGMATYQEMPVFIEWKSLPILFKSKILNRIENLALLLSTPKHPNFRSLQCRGLARDNDGGKVAFVYNVPPQAGSPIPRSLRNLFGMSPSVTERIQLALRITQSVKYFHIAGWLHKNLRSENIMFWDTTNSALNSPPIPSSALSEPILAGFAFSRQDSLSEISEQPSSDPQRDIYRHPEAMGEPSESFSAAKDIYALGTVLLEIGEWRSLRSLVEKVVDVSKTNVPLAQLALVKPFLLDEGPKGGLGMLKYRMGDIYAQVTKMMLSGEIPAAPQAQEEADVVFRPDMLDIAIRELGRCVV